MEPHTFEDTTLWLRRLNREWQFREPVDLHGIADPDVVEAASGFTLTLTLRIGTNLCLPTGAHVTVEIPATWDAHLGNCFRRGVRTVGSRAQITSGYGAFADVTCSNSSVKLGLAASWGRILDLVDIVVIEGEARPGDEIRLVLGPPDGNLIQAQKYAQTAVLTVGVDLTGERDYRRAATHPTVKVVGAHADRFRVFAPAVVQPNQEFDVRVLPVDIYSLNPATNYRGTATIIASEAIHAPSSLDVDTDSEPNGARATVRISSRGTHQITAIDLATGIAGRSNPIACGLLEDREVFFGELHSQMWHSMGTGTTDEFFEWGRDAAGLDFCAPANHYNWRFELTDEIWHELIESCNRFNEPGQFATLIGYEWGGSGGSGHKNVYYRDNTGIFDYWYRDQKNPDEFWASLEGRDVLTVPHHPKAFDGVDWSYRNDRHQRLVEICSNWGIAESEGEHSVQAALAMGHRLGFVGGTDSHYGLANQGSYHVNDGNGLTCAVATELSRDSIWQALYDRRCYATTGDRIVLDFTLNDLPMGTDLLVDFATYGPRRFSIRVAGTYRIDTVEILRNNQVLFSSSPGSDTWEGQWQDEEILHLLAQAPTFTGDHPFVFYYLRVTQGNRQQAWTSPIWLTES